jgi:hypothetical protein
MLPADHRTMPGAVDRALGAPAPADPGADPRADAREFSLLTGPDAADVLAAAAQVAGGELVSCRPRQVVHQPGRGTTAAYRSRVRWPDGAVTDETLVACMGDPPAGALVLGNGADRVAVWRFPHDPELPGLAAACDEAAVAKLLDEAGLGGKPVWLRTRAYRPRRRAVIEAVGSTGRLYIKVVRPDRVEALHDRHRLLVRRGIPAPQSLGWTPQGILVLQALAGRTLRQPLRTRTTTSIPSGGDILTLLDRLPEELADGIPRQTWLAKAPHYAAVIGAALPTEAARVAGLGEALSAAGSGPEWTGPVHGDFYEGQLLVDGGRICGLLDVDTAGPGDRLDDLACLLGHLSVLGQIDRDRAPIINGAGATYLQAFESVVSPAALRCRVAAVVVSLATGSHRVQERAWQATTRRRLELAEKWLASARNPWRGPGGR